MSITRKGEEFPVSFYLLAKVPCLFLSLVLSRVRFTSPHQSISDEQPSPRCPLARTPLQHHFFSEIAFPIPAIFFSQILILSSFADFSSMIRREISLFAMVEVKFTVPFLVRPLNSSFV